MKVCKSCKLEKDLSEFYEIRKGSYRYDCKLCTSFKRKELYKKKREGYIPKYRKSNINIKDKYEYNKRYRDIYKKELSKRKSEDLRLAKEEGIKYYGGKCACCGESQIDFLTMEHKNGRNKNIKRRTGKHAWLQAKRNNWPDDLTVLCFNCNCAKGNLGYCPHEKI